MPTITSIRPQSQLAEGKLKVIADYKESLEWNIKAIPDVEKRFPAVVHVRQGSEEKHFTVFERTVGNLVVALAGSKRNPQAMGQDLENIEADIMTSVLILMAGISQADKTVH